LEPTAKEHELLALAEGLASQLGGRPAHHAGR
jgi:hypothetical protein